MDSHFPIQVYNLRLFCLCSDLISVATPVLSHLPAQSAIWHLLEEVIMITIVNRVNIHEEEKRYATEKKSFQQDIIPNSMYMYVIFYCAVLWHMR